MRIIDITRPLSEKTVSFPGDPPPQFSQRDAGLYLISDLHMNSHSVPISTPRLIISREGIPSIRFRSITLSARAGCWT